MVVIVESPDQFMQRGTYDMYEGQLLSIACDEELKVDAHFSFEIYGLMGPASHLILHTNTLYFMSRHSGCFMFRSPEGVDLYMDRDLYDQIVMSTRFEIVTYGDFFNTYQTY